MHNDGMRKQVKVSIIIPTLNSGSTLKKCFEALQNQKCPSFEVIIVDNYSKDSTIQIAKEYGANILFHKGHASSARNIGLVNALGKYVLFLDSDQLVSDTLISECAEICERSNAAAANIPEVFIGKGFWSSCSAAWKNIYSLVRRSYPEDEIVLGNIPRFFDKKYLLSRGLFNEKLVWGEDYEHYYRLKSSGMKEEWCTSRIYHIEPRNLSEILLKNYRYGKSISNARRVKRNVHLWMIKQACLTLKTTLGKLPISTFVGCLLLLCFKSVTMLIGQGVNFLS